MSNSKSAVWNPFFVGVGFMALIVWNSCLNIVPYFILNVNDNIFTHITFAVSFGSLLSFLFAPVMFRKLSNSITILISLVVATLSFFLTIYIINTKINPDIKGALATFTVFIGGFMAAVIQGKGVAIAAAQSQNDIRLYNFGGGLNGIIISIVAFIVSFISPVNPDDPLEKKKASLLVQA